MDDSRDFDLDRMMERIRLNVRNRRRLAEMGGEAAAEPLDDGQAALHRDLVLLHQGYDVSSVSLNPNRRVFGRIILTAARLVSELLKPIIRRQTEYNAANTRLTDYLKRQVDALHPQYQQIRAMTERVLADHREDFRARTEALARRYAKIHADDMAMHARALSDLSQRVAALEQRQIELRQEIDRYDLVSLPDGLRSLTERVETIAHEHGRLADQAQRLGLLDTRYQQVATRIEALRELESRTESMARLQDEQFQSMRERVSRTERRLRRILSAETGNGNAAPMQPEAPAVPLAGAEMDYAGFEERMRDSRRVKEKQRGYVDYFAGKAPVLDVGCGRGEFLELMREAGTAAKGVDLDLDMTLLCADKGLDVIKCDAIDYLAQQPDDSLGGIFSAQVIEHLTPRQLNALIALASRKLRPGGTLLLETLNPESLFVHYKWFWMDPTHVRLVHPQTLQFLLESAGFVEVACRFASPPDGIVAIPSLQANGLGAVEDFNRATDYLNKLIFGHQEYFVIGRK